MLPLWRSLAMLAPRSLTDSLEAERARWFLWLPVALGGGVSCYFGLPAEPSLVLALALPVMAMAVLGRLARQARRRVDARDAAGFLLPGLRARQSAH